MNGEPLSALISDLAKIGKKRKNKASNDDWEHPHDDDARITKMKDGRTHLAHKAEHVVDMDSGALLGVSLHGADEGDTTTGHKSVDEAFDHLASVVEVDGELPPGLFVEAVMDKGYHSNESLLGWADRGVRTQISEPNRGRRRWKGKAEAKRAVHSNRRRIRSERGKRLQRQRGEKVERTFAHAYETGGMRRCHLRGRSNILKRLIVHAAGYNLSLLMRAVFGVGTPRQWAGASMAALATLLSCCVAIVFAWTRLIGVTRRNRYPRSPTPNPHTMAA